MITRWTPEAEAMEAIERLRSPPSALPTPIPFDEA